MWNLLQTSLAAIVGAYIYIKPPFTAIWIPSLLSCLWRSDKKASCSSGFNVSQPIVFAAWQISLTNIRSDIWKWPRHTQVRPLPVPFLCPPLTSCLAQTPSVTGGKLPRWVWFPLRWESDGLPWPSFWKTFQFSESLKASSLLSSFPSCFRWKVQRVLFICQPFQLTAAPTQHLSEGQHFSGSSVCLEPGLHFPHMDSLNALYLSSV